MCIVRSRGFDLSCNPRSFSFSSLEIRRRTVDRGGVGFLSIRAPSSGHLSMRSKLIPACSTASIEGEVGRVGSVRNPSLEWSFSSSCRVGRDIGIGLEGT